MEFDVFLSHNSIDKPVVRELKRLLTAHKLRAWLDADELVPGENWQSGLVAGIMNSTAFAVCIGPAGVGPWEDEEMQGALTLAVSERRRVIPILLPGAPDKPELSLFLRNRTWVDLREGFTQEGVSRFVWGITGTKPEVNSVDALQVEEGQTLQVSPPSSAPRGRSKSPRDYVDDTVSRVAIGLEETKPLTMRALTVQMNELFNRSTFRFEPLRECITQEWGTRLHAAMQTLELLRRYSSIVSDLAPDAGAFEKLMDEVNGYCLAMATYLFEGPIAVSEMRNFVGTSDFLVRLPKPRHFDTQIDDDVNQKVDGPRVRAIKQMDKLKKQFLGQSRRDQPNSEPTALMTWIEKLAYLQQQEALIADPTQKFTLRKQIEEAKAKIQGLGG
jgi:hypothetical protein